MSPSVLDSQSNSNDIPIQLPASFLIDCARGGDAALVYLWAHEEEAISASTIVLSEFFRGLLLTQEIPEEETMSNDDLMQRVPFTNETAQAAEARCYYCVKRYYLFPELHTHVTNTLSEADLRELIDLTADILTVVDDDGIIRYQSPSATEIAGYGQEEIVGDPVFEYIHPDDQPAALEQFREQVAAEPTDDIAKLEFRFRHNDGSWIWLETRGVNHLGTELDGYVMSSRDISERKQFEQQLKQERDRLDEFAGILSHDLRNPLNVAQGRLELLRDECDSDQIEAIQRAHTRMGAIIDDVLTIAREGGTVAELEPVALGSVIEECWNTIDTADARLVNEVESTVECDPSRVKHLFENVMRNAIEHGGDDVTVTVGTVEDGIYVEDDGPGFPDHDPDTVFEPGFSTKDGGTGFGLMIVKEIADAHDWDVSLHEGSDGGARLELTGIEFVT